MSCDREKIVFLNKFHYNVSDDKLATCYLIVLVAEMSIDLRRDSVSAEYRRSISNIDFKYRHCALSKARVNVFLHGR